jgi:diguanylate cyclase (GGDEF)-like protein
VLEPPQLLLALLAVCAALVVGLAFALVRARGRLLEIRREQDAVAAEVRTPAPVESHDSLRGWITSDYLRYLRQIHGPLALRQIPVVLGKFIVATFDPEGIIILIRRRATLADPAREHQLVVAVQSGTTVRPGGVIDLGDGDLGFVAQTRRVMDRRELDQTPSAGGDFGPLSGFHPELAAPLAVEGKTLGVVGIGRPRKPQAGGKELLELITHTAALAFENALVLNRIRIAASADPLTGIYNRGALMHRLQGQVAAAHERNARVAVFLFDVDHFTSYNETNGREAGDALLRLLASIVSAEVRADDGFGRVGGDEFLLLLPGRTAEEAEVAGDKVLRLVNEHRFRGESTQPQGLVTASGGVAVFPDHATSSSELLEVSHQALLRAQQRGGDRVEVGPSKTVEEALPAAVEVEADDLQRIKGIGPAFEETLSQVGISTYRDIAELNWTRMVLVASRLGTGPERIVSDRWLQQARELHLEKYGEEL